MGGNGVNEKQSKPEVNRDQVAAVAEIPGTKERPILFSAPMVRAILEGKKTQTRRVVKSDHIHGRRKLGVGELSTVGEFAVSEKTGLLSAYLAKFPGVSVGEARCPYGKPGDRLWVRETFVTFPTRTPDEQVKMRAAAEKFERGEVTDILAECTAFPPSTGPLKALYKADFGDWADDPDCDLGPWKPSIHMPRWASRITLVITEVRVQRLQDISELDAWAEGCEEHWETCSTCHGSGTHPYGDACICDGGGDRIHGERKAFEYLWDSINGKKSGCSWDDNPWVWALSFEREAQPTNQPLASVPEGKEVPNA